MSSPNLQWKRLQSYAMPPVVLKTKGVKVPYSTSQTLFAFFSYSCLRIITIIIITVITVIVIFIINIIITITTPMISK